MTIGWIDYLILDWLFSDKNKRYLTKSQKSIGLLTVIKFSRLKIYIKIFILATAVYDQNQLVFNQRPISQLVLLTGLYVCMIINNYKN